MRVGIITSAEFPPREGIGHFVTNLAKWLLNSGHDVTIFTRAPGPRSRKSHSGRIIIYQLPFLPLFPIHVHFHGLFLRRLLRQLKDRLDVLDFQSPLVPPANNIGIPSVATIHTLMVPAAQRLKLVGLHSALIKGQSYTVSRWLEERLMAQSSLVCSVRALESSELHPYKSRPAQIIPVGVGVHDSFLLPPPDEAQAARPPYVFYSGRLDYNKGLHDLISSIGYVARERPDVNFVLAGDGSLRPSLQAAAARDGVTHRVLFLGQLNDRDQMRHLHQKAALYVQPSYYEGLPAAILEAMACATPVVYTNTPGASGLISSTEGRLIPPGQPRALAAAILDVLSDEPRRRQMGQACRRKVLANYTWDIVSQRILACYQAAIDQGLPE